MSKRKSSEENEKIRSKDKMLKTEDNLEPLVKKEAYGLGILTESQAKGSLAPVIKREKLKDIENEEQKLRKIFPKECVNKTEDGLELDLGSLLRLNNTDKLRLFTFLKDALEYDRYKSLYKITAGHYQIDVGGIIVIMRTLTNNTSLQELNLGGAMINIGDKGATAVANMLRENLNLKTLSFWGGLISNKEAIVIANALKKNTVLTELNLHRNEIGDEGAIALADMLKENTCLKKFGLAGNRINSTGAIALSNMLKENTSLEELDIYQNPVSNEGIMNIADALKENTSLRILRIGEFLREEDTVIPWEEGGGTITIYGDKSGDQGATAVANMLKENTSLRSLDLTYSKISKKGAQDLINALKTNYTITDIILFSEEESSNKIAYDLRKALDYNKSLVKELAKFIVKNCVLTSLILKNEEAVKILGYYKKANKELLSKYLTEESEGLDVAKTLVKMNKLVVKFISECLPSDIPEIIIEHIINEYIGSNYGFSRIDPEIFGSYEASIETDHITLVG